MARFKRLTRADLDTHTRQELLERLDAEQQYWARKERRGGLSDADQQARREFSDLLFTVLNPEGLSTEMATLTAHLRGDAQPSNYWSEIPGQSSRP